MGSHTHGTLCLAKRERDKTTKFKALAAELGATFCPFAVDRYGGFGQQAVQLIKELIKYATEHSIHVSGGEPHPRYLVWAQMNKALHKGNVCLIRTALMRCGVAGLERAWFAPVHHDAGG